MLSALELCPGCGGLFDKSAGPTHRYMLSSPGCWKAFGDVLAREYSNPSLLAIHRLSVDVYAVQHPGDGSRQAIQSVGLHLARLMFQLESRRSPEEANALMLTLGKHKASLPQLDPPSSYVLTVRDVALASAPDDHTDAVQAWAQATWTAWSPHHVFIKDWVKTHL